MQIADKELPKSRRQQKLERSAPQHDDYVPPRQENDLKRKREEAEHDPKLKEFLDVYQPPSKTSLWANGEALVGESIAATDVVIPQVAVPEDESDDDYQVISKKPKIAADSSDKSTTTHAAPVETTTAQTIPEVVDADAAMEDVQDAPVAEQGPVSDADWLRSRTNRVLELVEDDEEMSVKAPAVKAPSPAPQTEQRAAPAPEQEIPAETQPVDQPGDDTSAEEDKIRETGRLYLRNLHFDVTEDELREQFSKSGAIDEVSEHFFPTRPCNDERQDRDN
jgi:multiple RNA-binding domain-containing protein 1